jgi:hypothetical protein
LGIGLMDRPRLEVSAMRKNAPGDPGQLVGERDGWDDFQEQFSAGSIKFDLGTLCYFFVELCCSLGGCEMLLDAALPDRLRAWHQEEAVCPSSICLADFRR